MSDPIDDMVAMRLAGAGPVLDEDTEHVYPPAKWSHPHAARPGAMPSVQDVVAELQTARGLLKALAEGRRPTERLHHGAYACAQCGGLAHPEWDATSLMQTTLHDPACPWRLAVEYLAGLEDK